MSKTKLCSWIKFNWNRTISNWKITQFQSKLGCKLNEIWVEYFNSIDSLELNKKVPFELADSENEVV